MLALLFMKQKIPILCTKVWNYHQTYFFSVFSVDIGNSEESVSQAKEEPNFELSGKLTEYTNTYKVWFTFGASETISYPEPAIFRRRIESSGIIHNRKPEILAFFARLLHSFLYQQPIRFTQIHGLSQSSRFFP